MRQGKASGLAARRAAVLGRSQPDRRVVENRTARRRAGLRGDQQVDTPALFEGAVGPDALHHHHILLQAVEEFHLDDQRPRS